MHRKLPQLVVITMLFMVLFYRQSIGLNLFIFETLLLVILLRADHFRSMKIPVILVVSGLILTAVFTVVHASAFVITMNLTALLLFGGGLMLPDGRSLVSIAGLAVANLFTAPAEIVNRLNKTGGRGSKVMVLIRQSAFFIIPILVILFFLKIYQHSNPIFSKWTGWLTDNLSNLARHLTDMLNFSFLGVLVLGLATAVFFVYRTASVTMLNHDREGNDALTAREEADPAGTSWQPRQRMEYRAALFLLIILNSLIALQNVLDIRWIWFGFSWNGEYLQQFVHHGTYLLIWSILVSIAIILWLFRGDLNHFHRSRLLKTLSIAWLGQNVILAFSVGMRVFWYIHFFALAYKRIGVIIFLMLTIAGLITVIIKVCRNRSAFYLLRTNALTLFIVLVGASCFNWDNIIARYNFSHYNQSFVHLNWLCTLSDKALPDLDKTPAFLSEVRQCQDKLFAFELTYMSPETYDSIMQTRKKSFLKEFSERDLCSWNLADQMAASRLRDLPAR
jgi:hypothetical protein